MSQPTLTLIIPAYNEETKIAKDIKSAFDYFTKTNLSAEVIIATDGVTDHTNLVVQKLQKQYPNLQLMSHFRRLGKGQAIKGAVAKAKGKYIMFADAGYCVPFKFITPGLDLLKSHDIAIGSRAIPGHRTRLSQPLYRQLGSVVFSWIIHYYIGIPHSIPDTQCGFKLFKSAVAKKLFITLDTPHTMFDIEILLKAHRSGYRIANFPVDWTNDPQTHLNPFRDPIKILKELCIIKTS